MISAWGRFRALSSADRALLLRAFLWLGVMRIGLAVLPYRVLQRLAGDDPHPMPRDTAAPLSRITWAIAAAARRIPGKASCLVQALAGQAMLTREGYESHIRIGVAGREPGGSIKAHAWVELGGKVVLGHLENLSEYSVLSSVTGT